MQFQVAVSRLVNSVANHDKASGKDAVYCHLVSSVKRAVNQPSQRAFDKECSTHQIAHQAAYR